MTRPLVDDPPSLRVPVEADDASNHHNDEAGHSETDGESGRAEQHETDSDSETDERHEADGDSETDERREADGDSETDGRSERDDRYEAVTTRPDGTVTPDRAALTAARHGYDGLVVRTRTDTDLAAVGARHGLDVVRAIEIHASDRSSASGAIGNHRPDCEVLLVRGNSPDLNRFAVESPRVDVLAAPFAGNGDVNHVVCKRAAANGVRIEVNLAPVLRTAGGSRVQALSDLRKLRELLADYQTPFVVTTRPASHLEFTTPRDLAAVGRQIGFSEAAIHAGLREWGWIARRTRRRRSEAFISPGVRHGPYEKDDR